MNAVAVQWPVGSVIRSIKSGRIYLVLHLEARTPYHSRVLEIATGLRYFVHDDCCEIPPPHEVALAKLRLAASQYEGTLE